MKIHVLAVAAALVIPAIASSDTKTDKTTDKTTDTSRQAKLPDGDIKAMSHVHHVNQMEIDMAKVAQKNGSDPVKRYAEQIERDHMTSDKELVSFAKRNKLATIPAIKPATPAEEAEHKEQMTKMSRIKTLKAPDFDREYLTMMVDGHEKELAKSDMLAQSATNPDLKKMIEDRKTTLTRHADMARELLKANGPTSQAPPKKK